MTAASVGGTVSEAAMAKLFTDLAAELTANKTTLSSSQLTDLKSIAANLNVGETASAYLTYITNALINGNAANAKWTGVLDDIHSRQPHRRIHRDTVEPN